MERGPVAHSAPRGLLEERWSRKLRVPVPEKSQAQRLEVNPDLRVWNTLLQSTTLLPSPSSKPRAAGSRFAGLSSLSTLCNLSICAGLTPTYSTVCLLQEAFPGFSFSPFWDQAPTEPSLKSCSINSIVSPSQHTVMAS